MNENKLKNPFLLVLLLGIFILSFFILRPFIYPIILAGAFSVVFAPAYRALQLRFKLGVNLASALATILVFIVIFSPLVFLGTQITKEATGLYDSVISGGSTGMLTVLISERISQYLPSANIDIKQYAESGLSWLLPHLGSLFSNTASLLLAAFIFFFSLFYFFKDGHRLKQVVVGLSPLSDSDDQMLLTRLSVAVNAVVRGNILIAIIQSIIATIGFTIFGVPNPALWGAVTMMAALVPGIGTALVLIPVIIYLFVFSSLAMSLGMLGWGMAAVGLVDNILGPRLMGRGTGLHPLLVFLSVIGGIAFFGPIGILLGPIVISLLVALFELYTLRLKN